MSRSTPEYNRQKIDVTFATSATTATDTTLTEPNLIHSMLLIAHTTAATLNSAASGAILSLRDSDGNVVKTYTEVLTGTTTLLSADVMIFPNDVIRYAITTGPMGSLIVSGSSVQTSEFPTATLLLYKY